MHNGFVNNRPDFSDYLAHFTKDEAPCCEADTPERVRQATGTHGAQDRLISILQARTLYASTVPWVKRDAVCLTECPWSSLLDHAKRYSPYAIGFTKAHVFAAGGGPAFYVRADLFKKQTWEPHLKTFVTPFMPMYAPAEKKQNGLPDGKVIDYSHEREWRVPHDFTFDYNEVQFVILDTYEDMAAFPKELKDAIGRERFLIMDVYRQIERLWPVHNL